MTILHPISFSGSPLIVTCFACFLALSSVCTGNDQGLTDENAIQSEAQSSNAQDQPAVNSEVDFGRDIAPIMAKNCVACHNAKKAEGGLNLESHSALLQGGDSGDSVEPGSSEGGYLLQRVLDDDDPMPPEDNAVGAKRLTASEVSLLRRWIELGALPPEEADLGRIQWQPLPTAIQPIYALSASPDGNYLALGRGNKAYVIRQSPTNESHQAFSLIDPVVGDTLQQADQSSDSLGLAGSVEQYEAAHLDMVHSIAFSPDSQLIATGGYRSVKIWERTTTPVDTLVGASVSSARSRIVSINTTGERLAVAAKNELELLDLAHFRSQRFLRIHHHPITVVEWLEDGVTLLTGDSSGAFALLNSETQQLRPLSGDSLPVLHWIVSVAPNQLAGLNQDGLLHRLELNLEYGTLAAEPLSAFNMASFIHRNPATPGSVGVSFQDGIFRLIDLQAASVLKEFPLSDPASLFEFSRDGRLVAAGTENGPTKVWRIEDGALIASLDQDYQLSQQLARATRDTTRQQGLITRLEGQLAELGKVVEAEEAARDKVQEVRDKAAEELAAKEGEFVAASQAVTEAESLLAQAETALAEAMKLVEQRKMELEAKQAAVTDASTKKEAAAEELAKREQALATAADATQRAQARIPVAEQQLADERQLLTGFQQSQQALADAPNKHPVAREIVFASDSERVIVADDSGRLHLYSSFNGAPEAILQLDSPAAALSVDRNNRLISLSNGGTAQFWDLNLSWKLKHSIGNFIESPFSDRITALDFSPDGTRLAVGSGPPSRFGEIHLLDPATGELVSSFGEVHSDSVFALKFSPDGRRLASGAADKIVRIYESATGQQLGTLEGHTHHVLAVSWNDDCATLATASADNSLKIWDVETGTQKRTVGGFKREVTAIGFVGQSNQLIAVDASGTAQLIDIDNGKQIRSFAGADGPLLSIGISPAGAIFYAGGQSGQQWGWQVEDGKPLQ